MAKSSLEQMKAVTADMVELHKKYGEITIAAFKAVQNWKPKTEPERSEYRDLCIELLRHSVIDKETIKNYANQNDIAL